MERKYLSTSQKNARFGIFQRMAGLGEHLKNQPNGFEKIGIMITKEELLANGFVRTNDDVFIYEKEIENRNPLNNDPEDTGVSLVVHRMYNKWTAAIVLPDGGLLNLKVETINDLRKVEEYINFYDPPY